MSDYHTKRASYLGTGDILTEEREIKYIGRNTIYGNPIKLYNTCPLCIQVLSKITDVLACYRKYLFWRLNPQNEALGQQVAKRAYPMPGAELPASQFRRDVLELDSKILVCPGCGRDHPDCHGRLLEKAIIWLKTKA